MSYQKGRRGCYQHGTLYLGTCDVCFTALYAPASRIEPKRKNEKPLIVHPKCKEGK